MKIAGYVHPGIFAEGPSWNYGWLEILAGLLRVLSGTGNCECILIVGSRFVRWAQESRDSHLFDGIHVVAIDEISLMRRLSALGVTPTIFNRLAYTQEESAHPALHVLAEEVVRASGQFQPDVLISFAMQTDFLSELWPLTLRLHTEAGPYSRNPFPFSLFFDHLGMYARSVVGQLGTRLNSLPTTADGISLVSAFRTEAPRRSRRLTPFDRVISGAGSSSYFCCRCSLKLVWF